MNSFFFLPNSKHLHSKTYYEVRMVAVQEQGIKWKNFQSKTLQPVPSPSSSPQPSKPRQRVRSNDSPLSSAVEVGAFLMRPTTEKYQYHFYIGPCGQPTFQSNCSVYSSPHQTSCCNSRRKKLWLRNRCCSITPFLLGRYLSFRPGQAAS